MLRTKGSVEPWTMLPHTNVATTEATGLTPVPVGDGMTRPRGATRSGLFGEGATLKGQKSRPLKGHESPKDSVQPIVRAKGVKNAHTRGCRRS